MRLTTDEFELISEALSVFTNSINNGKGLTIVNRQAGRLISKLEKNTEDYSPEIRTLTKV